MKTRRILSIVLALALMLALGAMAMAEEATAAAMEEAAAIEETKAATQTTADSSVWLHNDAQTVNYGKDITLNAEGLIPAEYKDWDVSYQWSAFVFDGGTDGAIDYATGPALRISRGASAYPDGKRVLGVMINSAQGNYYCTATVRNAAGDEVVLPLFRAEVTVKPPFLGSVVNFMINVLGSVLLCIAYPFILLFIHLFG